MQFNRKKGTATPKLAVQYVANAKFQPHPHCEVNGGRSLSERIAEPPTSGLGANPNKHHQAGVLAGQFPALSRRP